MYVVDLAGNATRCHLNVCFSGQVVRENLPVDDGDRCAGIDNHISLQPIDFYRYDQVVAIVFQADYFNGYCLNPAIDIRMIWSCKMASLFIFFLFISLLLDSLGAKIRNRPENQDGFFIFNL